MNPTKVAFGGKPRIKDPRDYNLKKFNDLKTGGAVAIPPSYQTDITDIPINMQNFLGICGAEAGTKLREVMGKVQTGAVKPLSPRATWINIKSFDGVPLDGGTTMDAIFQSGSKFGYAPLTDLVEDTTLPVATYSEQSLITPQITSDAQPNVLQSYAYNDNPSWQQVCEDIYVNKAVILLVQVGKEWYTAPDGVETWQESQIAPIRPPAQIIDGHFICAYGYDANYIYFINSWSTSWCRQGIGYFAQNYAPFFVEDGTEVIPPVGFVPALVQQKVSLLQRIIAKLQALLAGQ